MPQVLAIKEMEMKNEKLRLTLRALLAEHRRLRCQNAALIQWSKATRHRSQALRRASLALHWERRCTWAASQWLQREAHSILAKAHGQPQETTKA